MRQPKRNTNHIQESLKAQAGIRRAQHFAAGGTVAGWRGRKLVTQDRRKAQSKKACRGRVRS